jgi:hypothetical protein
METDICAIPTADMVAEYFDAWGDWQTCQMACRPGAPHNELEIAGRANTNELVMDVIAGELGRRGKLALIGRQE